MPRNLIDDKSTLVQVMAWCRQATSHYLNQWWPRSLTTGDHGIPRPQLVNTLRSGQNSQHFADRILKWIFFNENHCILIQISQKFVPKGSTDTMPGSKPFREVVLWRSITTNSATRLQWVNPSCAKFFMVLHFFYIRYNLIYIERDLHNGIYISTKCYQFYLPFQ